jgi:hypothetical protein
VPWMAGRMSSVPTGILSTCATEKLERTVRFVHLEVKWRRGVLDRIYTFDRFVECTLLSSFLTGNGQKSERAQVLG